MAEREGPPGAGNSMTGLLWNLMWTHVLGRDVKKGVNIFVYKSILNGKDFK